MSAHLLGWLLVVTAALWTVNCVWFVTRIGKERKPIDASTAAGDLLINVGMIVVVAIAAYRMLGG